MRGLWLGQGCLGPEGGRGRGRPVAWRLTWNPGLGSSYRKGSDASDHQGHTRTVSPRQGGKSALTVPELGCQGAVSSCPRHSRKLPDMGWGSGGQDSQPPRQRQRAALPADPPSQPAQRQQRETPSGPTLPEERRQCPPLRSPGCQQRGARWATSWGALTGHLHGGAALLDLKGASSPPHGNTAPGAGHR